MPQDRNMLTVYPEKHVTKTSVSPLISASYSIHRTPNCTFAARLRTCPDLSVSGHKIGGHITAGLRLTASPISCCLSGDRPEKVNKTSRSTGQNSSFERTRFGTPTRTSRQQRTDLDGPSTGYDAAISEDMLSARMLG